MVKYAINLPDIESLIDSLDKAINTINITINDIGTYNEKQLSINLICNIYNYDVVLFEERIKVYEDLGLYSIFCKKFRELSKERFIIWLKML